jgi:hypothetical protein
VCHIDAIREKFDGTRLREDVIPGISVLRFRVVARPVFALISNSLLYAPDLFFHFETTFGRPPVRGIEFAVTLSVVRKMPQLNKIIVFLTPRPGRSQCLDE